MFISECFRLNKKQNDLMESMGVFDAILDEDNNFFINIVRLKDSAVPEFKDAYQHINQFFQDIATILDCAKEPSQKDKIYRSARNKFIFHEVNGINLGFSKSNYGAGWGKNLSDRFLADAFQIIKTGSKQPEIFHLVSLFEEDVGPDRLSDMIATIIEPEINQYTLRIMQELKITPKTRPNLFFLKNGLVKNPYKDAPIQLLPIDVLHELPIAEGWDDVEYVASKNDSIRREISSAIGATWLKWASDRRKKYLKEHIFMDPDVCRRVIEGYQKLQLDVCDIKKNLNYYAEVLLKNMKEDVSFKQDRIPATSLDATKDVINIVKGWIENNRGWSIIQNTSTRDMEKVVQRLLHLGAIYYLEINNFDFSCEPNAGRGPVDIKICRGNDKTLVEIKLSTNDQYLHGFEVQIKEYAKAERTRNLVFVYVDLGNPGKRKKIIQLYNETKSQGKQCPDLIIIDARPKKSASIYNDKDGNDRWDDIFNQPPMEIPNIKLDIQDIKLDIQDIKLDIQDINFDDLPDSGFNKKI